MGKKKSAQLSQSKKGKFGGIKDELGPYGGRGDCLFFLESQEGGGGLQQGRAWQAQGLGQCQLQQQRGEGFEGERGGDSLSSTLIEASTGTHVYTLVSQVCTLVLTVAP